MFSLIVSDSLHASLVDAVNLSLPGVSILPGRRVIVVENAQRSYVVVKQKRAVDAESAGRNIKAY